MYRIVSFDGGGIRGLLSARMLDRLSSRFDIIGKADMIAGTSTGGLIALALANGMKPAEVVSWYWEHGPEVFGSPRLLDGDLMTRAKYYNGKLAVLLEQMFGHKRLVDLSKRVVIPAFRLDPGTAGRWQPSTFDGRDSLMLARWVGLATSAAPTYFPTALVGGWGMCDGGVYANDPSIEALTIALRDGVPIEEIRLLSFGTGLVDQAIPEAAEGALDWGALEWGVKLVDVLLEGPQEAVAVQCNRIPKLAYTRMNPKLEKAVALDAADLASLSLLIATADRAGVEDAVDLLAAAGW